MFTSMELDLNIEWLSALIAIKNKSEVQIKPLMSGTAY